MKIKTYRFKQGSRLNPKAAKAAGERLAELHERHGGLTPELVLADARKARSPLRGFFDWNNGSAAEKYRLEQARHLIRSVEVIYTPIKGKAPKTTRAYVTFRQPPREDLAPYLATAQVMSDADLRASLVAEALGEVRRWRQRYKDLAELSKIFAAIDATKVLARTERRSRIA